MAHTEVLGAYTDQHPAIWRGLGLGELGRDGAVVLYVERDSDPGEAPRGARRRPPGREAAPVGEPCRPLQVLGERARGQDRAPRRGPGQFGGAHQVAPPELEAVDPGVARGRVDQALHDVVGFDPADAAVGSQRGGVREHATQAEVAAGDAVGTTQRRSEVVEHGPNAAGHEVSSVAPVGVDPDRGEAAALI